MFGRAGDYAIWLRDTGAGRHAWLMKLGHYEAELVKKYPWHRVNEALMEMKSLSGVPDREFISIVLAKLWRAGRRDVVRDLTSTDFVDDVIMLTRHGNFKKIPLEEAIEIVLALRVRGERCR